MGFGGALDDAAKMFAEAHDSGISPKDFIEKMKKTNQLIMGIGHRIKSLANPDQRVEIIKAYAKKHFASTPILDFALGVEQLTTRKRANLILNVDGCIAVAFVDMILLRRFLPRGVRRLDVVRVPQRLVRFGPVHWLHRPLP